MGSVIVLRIFSRPTATTRQVCGIYLLRERHSIWCCRVGPRGDCGYESIFTQECPGLISCSGHGRCSDSPQFKCDCRSVTTVMIEWLPRRIRWTCMRRCYLIYKWNIATFTWLANLWDLPHRQSRVRFINICCYCSVGWSGGDCSEKLCPFGESWFSFPEDDNSAHLTMTECSNAGLCDRTTGSPYEWNDLIKS